MNTSQLIRLLLAVRQMNLGQFWDLLRKLGASAVLPPEPMEAEEIEAAVQKIVKR